MERLLFKDSVQAGTEEALTPSFCAREIHAEATRVRIALAGLAAFRRSRWAPFLSFPNLYLSKTTSCRGPTRADIERE
jgi:hypothetical protein